MNPIEYGINSSNFSPNKSNSGSKGEESEDDIAFLLDNVPELDSLFMISRKIGYGTFSSVYLGYSKTKSANGNKKCYAIKHIIPTSHPSRIFMELKCLQLMGGKSNIIEATLCLRNLNHIVLVMPYFSHDVFSEYVGKLTIQETCDYIYNLLQALEKVHSYNIVHRDIKPSNFLFSRKHRRYALIDFGLAQDFNKDKTENIIKTSEERKNFLQVKEVPKMLSTKPIKRKIATAFCSSSYTPSKPESQESVLKRARLLSTPVPIDCQDCKKAESNNTLADSPSKHTRLSESVKPEKVFSKPSILKTNEGDELSVQFKRNFSLQTSILRRSPRKLQNMNRIKFLKGFSSSVSSSGSFTKSLENSVGASISGYSCAGYFNSDAINNASNVSTLQEVKTRSGKTILCPTSCRCYGSAKVCSICLGRKSQHAPRAGTPGFRAPEVLLRHPNQTTALDIWSAGVILLCLASSRCSFFRPVDDVSSLAEITTIFGTRVMKKVAANLEKLFTCSEDIPPLDLRLICEKLRTNSSLKTESDDTKVKDRCEGCKQISSYCVCLVSKNSYVGKSSSKNNGDLKSSSMLDHDISNTLKSEISPYPMSLYDLLYKLLDPNPNTRITAKKALFHPLFEEYLKTG